MSFDLEGDLMRKSTAKSSLPLVFRKFIDWPLCHWSREKWSLIFGDREIPFRCLKKNFISEEPCWERRCKIKNLTFKNFIDNLTTSEEWMYFDYKYIHQWFSNDNELIKVRSH